jgi:hypothetical protein
VEDIDNFLEDFVAGNSKKIANIGFGRNNQFSPQCVRSHCQIFKIFNSENVKNKECVHTWANDSGYTSYNSRIFGPLVSKVVCLFVLAG